MSEPPTEAPAPDVRTAVRLGWAVAELRGRSWPEGSRPATSSLPPRPEHTLPLQTWTEGTEQTGVSLQFLFGADRRRELTRMLGRLGSGQMHPLSASAISGSIEAWGRVAADDAWAHTPDLREQLYEQTRRWYQLLVLDQDPTTMVKPYAKLSSPHNFFRFMRLYRLQIILGIIAFCLIVAFFAFRGQATSEWIPSIVGILGVGGAVLTGVLTRAKDTAERLATRMRQDAYTDLVAVALTSVPKYPGTARPNDRVENAVRRRRLTPATAPPPD